MFHLAAYTGNLALATPLLDVPALTDGIVYIQNTHFVFQQATQLYAVAAMSPTLTEVQLATPKLRQVSASFVRPLMAGAALPSQPERVDWMFDNPLTLNGPEETQILASCSAAGPERFTAGIWVGDALKPAPIGDMYTLKGTSATAATANAWSAIPITWAVQIPLGTYAVVWAECFSTNGQLFRLTFDQQWQRPGFIMGAGFSNYANDRYYDRNLGVWGTFRTTNQPRVEVLCNAADASFTIYLRVVRVSFS